MLSGGGMRQEVQQNENAQRACQTDARGGGDGGGVHRVWQGVCHTTNVHPPYERGSRKQKKTAKTRGMSALQ